MNSKFYLYSSPVQCTVTASDVNSNTVKAKAIEFALHVDLDFEFFFSMQQSRGSLHLQDLAAASQDEVNAMWAGLGYYRRARFLLDGAKYIEDTLSGQMPVTAAELQKIPGRAAIHGPLKQVYLLLA